MALKSAGKKIDDLIRREEWDAARRLIESELESDPESHWLLTQLGVTYYEQRKYRTALKWFVAAQKIKPDCPLMLWNLAGTLDALGQPARSVPIYTWLLQSDRSPDDDPCWESPAWAESLKTDCVYRLGLCLEHSGQTDSAEQCFRQYINLLLIGMKGMYSLEDAARHVQDVHGGKPIKPARELRAVIDATLHDAGLNGRRRKLPKLAVADLLAG